MTAIAPAIPLTQISYTGLRQVPRIDLAAAIPLPAPLTVHVEPTNICNFRCSFCPVSLAGYAEQSGFHQHLPMPLYRKILDDIRDLGRLRALKFYFIGEPFLNPNLTEMVRMARDAGVADRLEVTANGSILPADAILDSGLDYLRVSIYTPRSTRITRNVRRLFERRAERGLTRPFLCVKYMPDGPDDRAEFLRTYDGLADESIIEGYHNWASTEEMLVAPPTAKRNCPFVHYMMVIRANGDVVPCCVDWNSRLRLGSVADATLREIWDGESRRRLVEAHVAGQRGTLGQCAKCDLPDTTPDNLDSLTPAEYQSRVEARQ